MEMAVARGIPIWEFLADRASSIGIGPHLVNWGKIEWGAGMQAIYFRCKDIECVSNRRWSASTALEWAGELLHN